MDSDISPGSVVAGYRIESVVGRGGMGVVYRATQLTLERPVALKLLAAEFAQDDGFRQRFQRESKLLAAIDHPNVITVHEAGEHEGRLFIAMRYVEGEDLREVIRREGALASERAAELIRQVADALDAAHARGLIHRDVKPANVLIERREGREHAYLSDFGLTKPVSSTAGGMTASGQWVGTADFVAPEQVRGEALDARADVYALGCVLFTTLTGRVPFDRDSEVAKIFAHVSEPPPSARAIEPALPETLDRTVKRAMAKERDDRFPSAGDLARAATAAVAGGVPADSERSVARGTAAPRGPGGDGAPTVTQPSAPGPRSRSRRLVPIAAVAAVMIIVAIAAAVLLGGGSEGDDGGGARSDLLSAITIPVPSGSGGITIGGGRVWVASSQSSVVTPIDADSRRPAEPVQLGDTPSSTPGLAVSGDSLLVSVAEGEAIVRVPTDSGKRDSRFPIAQTVHYGPVVAGDGSLWVTLQSGEIGRLSPKDGGISLRTPGPPPGLDGPLAVGGGSVWATASREDRSFLARFDSRTGRIDAQIDLGKGVLGEGVAYGEGAAWVADTRHNDVLRVDPKTNRVVKRIRIETGISNDIAVGAGAVWVLNGNDDKVSRVNPDTNRPIGGPTTISTSEASELAVGLGAAWVTSPDDNSVTRLGFGNR